LLVVTSLIPLGFFGRDCLYEDYTILSYNSFNQINEAYTKGMLVRKGSIQIVIDAKDGNSFSFSPGNFAKNTFLDEMLKMKESFPSQEVTVSVNDPIDMVLRDMNLNEEESQKLKALLNDESEKTYRKELGWNPHSPIN